MSLNIQKTTLRRILLVSILVCMAALCMMPAASAEASEPYLTFSSAESFTLGTSNSAKNWDGTLEYSTDTQTWTVWNGESISSSADGKLYLHGTGNSKISNLGGHFTLTGSSISCTGNIETLLDYQMVASGIHPVMSMSCFSYLFSDCTGLTTAPELSAITLAEDCYGHMFSGCTGLTTAPELLPATTLTEGCYMSMFSGCIGLTSAPELPATTLAGWCYYHMFDGCTGLTTSPKLPATTLADKCYEGMFEGCTGLTTAPELLPATNLVHNCYAGMFSGCIGLATAPKLPATTLADGCYQYMFSGCTDLTTAPELSATTLADSCYIGMFYGCTGIKLSETQTDEYTKAWSFPSDATTSATYWNTNMFTNTGGTFTGSPEIGKTYYLYDRQDGTSGEGILLLNPIPSEITKGSLLVVSGYTQLGEDTVVGVEMISYEFVDVPTEALGPASFIALTTKTDATGYWEVTFDTSRLNVDEYFITVHIGDFQKTAAKINVIADSKPPIVNPPVIDPVYSNIILTPSTSLIPGQTVTGVFAIRLPANSIGDADCLTFASPLTIAKWKIHVIGGYPGPNAVVTGTSTPTSAFEPSMFPLFYENQDVTLLVYFSGKVPKGVEGLSRNVVNVQCSNPNIGSYISQAQFVYNPVDASTELAQLKYDILRMDDRLAAYSALGIDVSTAEAAVTAAKSEEEKASTANDVSTHITTANNHLATAQKDLILKGLTAVSTNLDTIEASSIYLQSLNWDAESEHLKEQAQLLRILHSTLSNEYNNKGNIQDITEFDELVYTSFTELGFSQYISNTFFADELYLLSPFVSITDAAAFALKDRPYTITGTAVETDSINYYIFGPNYFKHGKATVTNNKFSIQLSTSGDTGYYFVVCQHPMYDTNFDVWAEKEENGMTAIKASYYNPSAGNSDALFYVEHRQHPNAAATLCKVIDVQIIDDIYTKYSFVVTSPISMLNPVPSEITKGSTVTVSGQTNMGANLAVTVEMISTPYVNENKEQLNSKHFIASTTKTDKEGNWEVTFDTSGLDIGEYHIIASIGGRETVAKTNVIAPPVTDEGIIIEKLPANNVVDLYKFNNNMPKLMVSVKGESGTLPKKDVTWTSSNPSVLSIDDDGRYTPHKVGKAIITAKTDKGTASGTLTVIDTTPEQPNLPIKNPTKGNDGKTKMEPVSGGTPIQVSSDKKTAVIGTEGTDTAIMIVTFKEPADEDTTTGSVTGKVQSVVAEYKPASAAPAEGVGGTVDYQLNLELTNVTTELPMINAGINPAVANKVTTDYPKLKLAAMITAETNVATINNNLTKTGNGITITFNVPKAWVDSMEKIWSFHVKEGVIIGMVEISKADIQDLGNGYCKVTIRGTSFSTHGLAGEEKVTVITPPADNTPSSSPQGSSVWLTESPTPTQTPTEQPTEPEQVPTSIPTTQPTETPDSPLSVLGVVAGLGAVAVLRRK